MGRTTPIRYLVKVTDWSSQEAYIGTFLRHERAEEFAKRINEKIVANSQGMCGWASVIKIEPNPGVSAMVEWALGYPGEVADFINDETTEVAAERGT